MLSEQLGVSDVAAALRKREVAVLFGLSGLHGLSLAKVCLMCLRRAVDQVEALMETREGLSP